MNTARDILQRDVCNRPSQSQNGYTPILAAPSVAKQQQCQGLANMHYVNIDIKACSLSLQ